MKRIHVFNNVEMRFGLWKYTYLVMQKYGHDESAPTPDGMFRGCFAEYSPPIHGTFVAAFQFVRHIIIIYITHYRNSSATLSQTVHNIIANRPQHHRKPSATLS